MDANNNDNNNIEDIVEQHMAEDVEMEFVQPFFQLEEPQLDAFWDWGWAICRICQHECLRGLNGVEIVEMRMHLQAEHPQALAQHMAVMRWQRARELWREVEEVGMTTWQ